MALKFALFWVWTVAVFAGDASELITKAGERMASMESDADETGPGTAAVRGATAVAQYDWIAVDRPESGVDFDVRPPAGFRLAPER